VQKNSKSILVTGCAGFIGFHLTKRLLDEGFYVIGIDNMNDYYDTSLKYDRLKMIMKHPRFQLSKAQLRTWNYWKIFSISTILILWSI